MHSYTVYLRPQGAAADDGFVLVKDGFCWPAFFLSVLWALWHRLWWVALLMAVASTGVDVSTADLGLIGQVAVGLGLAAAFGTVAAGLQGWTLERNGYVSASVVTGSNLADAERRYLDSAGPSGMVAP